MLHQCICAISFTCASDYYVINVLSSLLCFSPRLTALTRTSTSDWPSASVVFPVSRRMHPTLASTPGMTLLSSLCILVCKQPRITQSPGQSLLTKYYFCCSSWCRCFGCTHRNFGFAFSFPIANKTLLDKLSHTCCCSSIEAWGSVLVWVSRYSECCQWFQAAYFIGVMWQVDRNIHNIDQFVICNNKDRGLDKIFFTDFWSLFKWSESQ